MAWIPFIDEVGLLAPPFILQDTQLGIEAAIYYLLVNDGSVTDITGTRIYPAFVPQGVSLPAITYTQITGSREHTFDGIFGMSSPVYVINCWGENYEDTRDLADAVRGVLSGYSGTARSIKIYSVFLQNEMDMSEILPAVGKLKRWGKSLDFMVWYEE